MDLQVQMASFLLDIPILLPLSGYLSAKMGKSEKQKKGLLVLSLLGFWIVAGGFYFDVLSLNFLLGEAGGGNYFMWNSGVELLGLKPLLALARPSYQNFWSWPNLAAMALFLFVYPADLMLGFKLGHRSNEPIF